MITSANSPMPPIASPRKAARIVKPSKPVVAMAPPKMRFQMDGVKPLAPGVKPTPSKPAKKK